MKTALKKSKLIPCRVAGCDHAPFPTRGGEATHYHRVHSGRIRVKGQRRKRQIALHTNGDESPIHLGKDRPAPETAEPAVRQKRQYRKRTTRKTNTTQVDVCFCPACGTDLKAVAIGLLMKGVKVNVGFCPGCGLNLHNVAIGMAMTSLKKV